ncbi:Smr/MutS family protein [Phenylobacterium sp.]|jgi:DNA-nicking Smr family endonuclease|uniref:Smr/MutS family protein n=1 Tax=Phenylobacterium sp. TaxID=1871053 RepID=UPI002F93DFD9
MKRPLKPEELRVWSRVAGTVHPLPGRILPSPPGEGQPATGGPGEEVAIKRRPHNPVPTPPHPGRPAAGPSPGGEGKPIEPNRKHRIAKAREEIGARLDLHGLDQDRARATLEAFLHRAWDEGFRAVLVITGKGVQGDGILRRRVPEWLAAPHLIAIVAGIAEAHRRHGGEGALYVALKRKPRT